VDEDTKNPSQLTDEDRNIVDELYAGCIVVMFRIMQKYRTPKRYVQESVLKTIASDKKFAIGRIMINSFTQKYDSPLSPKKINKDLAEEANLFVQDENLTDSYALVI